MNREVGRQSELRVFEARKIYRSDAEEGRCGRRSRIVAMSLRPVIPQRVARYPAGRDRLRFTGWGRA
jgi:hypothetical protein